MTFSPAITSILKTYDSEELNDIANHGCASGCASSHIYYTETTEFFDKYEEDIYDSLRDIFGEDFLFELVTDCHDMTDMKNKLVWTFIELVAYDYINSMTDEEVYAEVA
jgi:hypothetical protein